MLPSPPRLRRKAWLWSAALVSSPEIPPACPYVSACLSNSDWGVGMERCCPERPEKAGVPPRLLVQAATSTSAPPPPFAHHTHVYMYIVLLPSSIKVLKIQVGSPTCWQAPVTNLDSSVQGNGPLLTMRNPCFP